jgi:hypothetical protein
MSGLVTKEELKEQYSAPKEEGFETKEEYLNAKIAWVASNPDEYQEILNASSADELLMHEKKRGSKS